MNEYPRKSLLPPEVPDAYHAVKDQLRIWHIFYIILNVFLSVRFRGEHPLRSRKRVLKPNILYFGEEKP